MRNSQPVLTFVAVACLVGMYSAVSSSGTSFLWLSAFCALVVFFVHTASRFGRKPSDESFNSCRRINSVVAYTLLLTCFLYGLKTLGPLRFIMAAASVAGLPNISRYRKGPRFAKYMLTALCSSMLLFMDGPGHVTSPSVIYGAVGLLCTALAGRLAVSEVVKSADAYALLLSAAATGVMGFVVTVFQKHAAAANEMQILLFFCVATAIFFGSVSAGLLAHANVLSAAAVITGVFVSSFSFGVAPFPSLRSWECLALVVASLSLLGAHKGIVFSEDLSPSVGAGSFDPAQLFRKAKQPSDSEGFITTLMSNSRERKLFVFLILTTAIMLLEFLYGVAVNSLGLISDSFHMMLDGTSIAIGLYAAHAASWRPDEKTHPFGYARYEVFGGFVNGVLLLFIALYVTVESIQRIVDPPEIEGPYLLLVSFIGLVVNIIGIIFFHDSHGHSHTHAHGECGGGGGGHIDHNIRGVYLHILADLLGSVSVIISSVVIYLFDFWVTDPICSALSAVLILLSAFPLLEETGRVLLLSAPDYNKNYASELRAAILDTGFLQDVTTPVIWAHSTPPRELTICVVAGKIRSNAEYMSVRRKLTEITSHHMARHLGVRNISVILHLE